MGLHTAFENASKDRLVEVAERAGVSTKGDKDALLQRVKEAVPDSKSWRTNRGLSSRPSPGEPPVPVCDAGDIVPSATLTVSGSWMYARGWLFRGVRGEES